MNREYDVFNVNAKVLKCEKDANDFHTIIKQFNLETTRTDNNQHNNNNDIDNKIYLYKPKTVLSAREKVWEILKDECFDDDMDESNDI